MINQEVGRLQSRHLIQANLEHHYFEAFNFYFAKPINEILSNSRTPLAILVKDYSFYDNQHESMRRWYTIPESVLRLNNYAEFFEEIKKQYYPFVSSNEIMKIMNKRLYRIHKLRQNNKTMAPSQEMPEKQASRTDGRRNALPTENILKGLHHQSHIIVEYS